MKTMPAKKIFSLLVVSAFLCSFMPQPFYQADFSGTWKLNEAKSERGQFGGRGMATKLVVDQKPDAITLSKTAPSMQGGEATTSETLMFSGKESEITVFGAAKKKSTLKWSADGNTMMVNYSIAFERDGQSNEFKGVETWSLSADGKSLVVQTNLTTPQGDVSTKAVYDK